MKGITSSAKPSAENDGIHDDRPGGRLRRRRRLVIIIGVLAVFLLAGVVGVVSQQDDSPTKNGVEAAPAFVLPNLKPGGPRVSLTEFRGHPLVLNFFASWCVPCRKEMPAFEQVHGRLGSRVVFLGVDNQDQQDPALQLVRETGVTYPAGYDPTGKVAGAYGLFGMPTTIFISPEGRVLKRHTGQISESDLETTIRQLLLS